MKHLGIDIAKRKFDVALIIDGKYRTHVFDNSVAGHRQLMAWLVKHDEPHRVLWRHQHLREWCHEQETEQVFPRSQGACSPPGARAPVGRSNSSTSGHLKFPHLVEPITA